MSGEIDIVPGWKWQAGQPVAPAALDSTGSGMTATVRANSIGKRELNPLDVADLVKSVVSGYRVTVKTTSDYTLNGGYSVLIGPYTVAGITTSMVVVPVGLVLSAFLVGGNVVSANTFFLNVRNPLYAVGGARTIPAGTSFTVVII